MTTEKKYQQACEEFYEKLKARIGLWRDLKGCQMACAFCGVHTYNNAPALEVEGIIEPTGLHSVPRTQTQFKLICKHCGHIMFFDSTKLE